MTPERDFATELENQANDSRLNIKPSHTMIDAAARIRAIEAELSTLRDENKRLAGLIETAPHGKECPVLVWEMKMWGYGSGVRGCKHPGQKPDCYCWKSKALAPADKPSPEPCGTCPRCNGTKRVMRVTDRKETTDFEITSLKFDDCPACCPSGKEK